MNIKNFSNIFFFCIATCILGISVGVSFGWSPVFFMVSALGVCISVCVLWYLGEKSFFILVILGVSFCVLGAFRYHMVTDAFNTRLPKGTVSGRVVSNPADTTYGQSFVFKTNALQKVVMRYAGDTGTVFYGDQIRGVVLCERPKNFETDLGGVFDYVTYLKKDHIYAVCSLDKIYSITPSTSFLKHLYVFADNLSAHIRRVFVSPYDAFISGILVGDKTTIDEDMRNDFIKTGTIHILALSGYNIAIVALFFQKFFYVFFRKRIALTLSLISVVLFVAMTGFSATAVRAGMMALIVIFAQISYQPYAPLRALFFASFLMILYDPFYLLYDSSFHLSFLATFGIIVCAPLCEVFFTRIPSRFLRLTSATTCSAYLITLPYLLFFFNGISVFSVIVNTLITPLIPVVMLGSALSLSLSVIHGSFSFVTALFTEWVASLILSLIHLFAKIPFGYFSVSISWWVCFGMYVMLFLGMYKIGKMVDRQNP